MVRVAKSKILVTRSPTIHSPPKVSKRPASRKKADAARQSPKSPSSSTPKSPKEAAAAAAMDANARVTKRKPKAAQSSSPKATKKPTSPKAAGESKPKSKPLTKREEKMTVAPRQSKRQAATVSSSKAESKSKATSPAATSTATRSKVAVKSAGYRFDLDSDLDSEAESDSESDVEPAKSPRKTSGKPTSSPKKSPKSPQKSPKSPQTAQGLTARSNRSLSSTSPKKPLYSRRKGVLFTEAEVEYLRQGVNRYGFGAWADIRQDPQFKFNPVRTAVDLKDKWRNLGGYRRYSERQMRKYMLIGANHEPILNRNGRIISFNNRWPRDAAMKVTSRDDFYPHPESTGPITIYLKETRTIKYDTHIEPVVHVYTGTRYRVSPVDIKKFAGVKLIWKSEVKKLRTEMLSYGAGAFTEAI